MSKVTKNKQHFLSGEMELITKQVQKLISEGWTVVSHSVAGYSHGYDNWDKKEVLSVHLKKTPTDEQNTK